MTQRRTLGWLSLTVAALTLLWVVLLVVQQATAPAPTSIEAKAALLAVPGPLHYVAYANGCVLTLATAMLFGGIHLMCREQKPLTAIVGLVCVPIYGLANLVAYGSQIFLVPRLAALAAPPEGNGVALALLPLALQDWPGSAMQALNLGAYAILGISSLLYGQILIGVPARLRAAGTSLIVSGALSLVALAGAAIGSQPLAALTLVSGLAFLVALLGLGTGLLRRGAPVPRSAEAGPMA